MRPGWIAGGVRARLLTNRRLGRDGARRLARAEPAAAVALLADSPYGRTVDAAMDPTAASRAAAETTLWHLRVLGGWLTGGGTDIVRRLSGWFEIVNVEGRLDALRGRPSHPPFSLGGLEVAWRRAERAGSAEELRRVLASSAWGDPGGTSPADVGVGLRLAWARRIVDGVPAAADWAEGGAALIVAREALVFDRPLRPRARADAIRLLGRRWTEHRWSTPTELAEHLTAPNRSILAELAPDQLVQAESRWRRWVEREALGLVRRGAGGPDVIAAAVVLLILDLWRVESALEASRWGDAGSEVFDAVA